MMKLILENNSGIQFAEIDIKSHDKELVRGLITTESFTTEQKKDSADHMDRQRVSLDLGATDTG